MTMIRRVKFWAALSIICALLAGIYMNVSGNNPNVLSSRSVMVCGYRR